MLSLYTALSLFCANLSSHGTCQKYVLDCVNNSKYNLPRLNGSELYEKCTSSFLQEFK